MTCFKREIEDQSEFLLRAKSAFLWLLPYSFSPGKMVAASGRGDVSSTSGVRSRRLFQACEISFSFNFVIFSICFRNLLPHFYYIRNTQTTCNSLWLSYERMGFLARAVLFLPHSLWDSSSPARIELMLPAVRASS